MLPLYGSYTTFHLLDVSVYPIRFSSEVNAKTKPNKLGLSFGLDLPTLTHFAHIVYYLTIKSLKFRT